MQVERNTKQKPNVFVFISETQLNLLKFHTLKAIITNYLSRIKEFKNFCSRKELSRIIRRKRRETYLLRKMKWLAISSQIPINPCMNENSLILKFLIK